MLGLEVREAGWVLRVVEERRCVGTMKGKPSMVSSRGEQVVGQQGGRHRLARVMRSWGLQA